MNKKIIFEKINFVKKRERKEKAWITGIVQVYISRGKMI